MQRRNQGNDMATIAYTLVPYCTNQATVPDGGHRL